MPKPIRRAIGLFPAGKRFLAGRNALSRAQIEINIARGLPGKAGSVARKGIGVTQAELRSGSSPRVALDRVATMRNMQAYLLKARRKGISIGNRKITANAALKRKI